MTKEEVAMGQYGAQVEQGRQRAGLMMGHVSFGPEAERLRADKMRMLSDAEAASADKGYIGGVATAIPRSVDDLIKLWTEAKHVGLRSFTDETCEFHFEREQRARGDGL